MKLPAQLPTVAGDREGKIAYADGIAGAGLFDSVFGGIPVLPDVLNIGSAVACELCDAMPSPQREICRATCRVI